MNAKPRLTPLASCLAAAFSLACPAAFAVDLHVTNCGDAGTGSLRAAIASAASTGDRVVFDVSTMHCSTITLTSGELQINAEELTIQGPTTSALSIDGNHISRVLNDGVTVGSPDSNRKLTINNLTIMNGQNTGSTNMDGGCIHSDGDLTLSSSTVTGCSVISTSGSAFGGAAFANSLHVYNSMVTNNVASATAPPTSQGNFYFAIGAGLLMQGDGDVIIQGSTISSNHAIASGVKTVGVGAGLLLFPKAAVSITSSSITGNDADLGAGVYLYAADTSSLNIVIDRSTVSGNTSAMASGLWISAVGSSLVLKNSTVSGNVSTNTVGGIAAFTATSTFINDTIAFNTAATTHYLTDPRIFPAGVFAGGAMTNTIVAHNTLTGAVESDFGSGGIPISGVDNLIMATAADSTAPMGTLTADPMLGTLANNGGPTMTHALLSGSPAIDAGCGTTQQTDQRGSGFPRIWGPTTDIGSFEFGDPASGDIIFKASFDALACPP